MILKYTGPKEIISAHGISFKNGKDDKYVYIYPAFQIYKALHHDYEKGHIYSHNIEGKSEEDEHLTNEILQLRPDLKRVCEEQIKQTENYLKNEIETVSEYKGYNEDEKRVYKNNLIIMENYRVQRDTNKIIYHELIKIIVDDIIEHRIKEINTPFNERYWHILQTIQGELSNHGHRSIGSNLDTIEDEENVRVVLKITAFN